MTARFSGGSKPREGEFYETPAWAVNAIIPYLGNPKRILDAGAGTGAIMAACEAYWPEVQTTGVELNPALIAQSKARGAIMNVDFLSSKWSADLIISNPPYSRAFEFLQIAFKQGRQAAFLLPLMFLTSKGRKAFHKEFPAALYVLAERPSFGVFWKVKCESNSDFNLRGSVGIEEDARAVAKASLEARAVELGLPIPGDADVRITTTDANAYGWFCWGEGHTPGTYKVL